MAPSVAPRLQVRGAGAAARPQGRGYLRNAQSRQARAYDHLGRELHARGPQTKLPDRAGTKSPQAAMKVLDRHLEEYPADQAQYRVAEIVVQQRHRSRHYPSAEAVAHDQVVPGSEVVQEGAEIRKIVAVVRISHDDVLAARGGDAANERRAISSRRHSHNTRPEPLGNSDGAVGAAVVGNQDLAAGIALAQEILCPRYARGDGFRLVEAGHQYRQLDRARVICVVHKAPIRLVVHRAQFVERWSHGDRKAAACADVI